MSRRARAQANGYIMLSDFGVSEKFDSCDVRAPPRLPSPRHPPHPHLLAHAPAGAYASVLPVANAQTQISGKIGTKAYMCAQRSSQPFGLPRCPRAQHPVSRHRPRESLNGEKYGLEFDWYSYGVTLFELLTRCGSRVFLPAVAPPKTRTYHHDATQDLATSDGVLHRGC